MFAVFALKRRVIIIFNNFENDTMKLLVNEAKSSGLGGRNFVTIQLVWI